MYVDEENRAEIIPNLTQKVEKFYQTITQTTQAKSNRPLQPLTKINPFVHDI